MRVSVTGLGSLRNSCQRLTPKVSRERVPSGVGGTITTIIARGLASLNLLPASDHFLLGPIRVELDAAQPIA